MTMNARSGRGRTRALGAVAALLMTVATSCGDADEAAQPDPGGYTPRAQDGVTFVAEDIRFEQAPDDLEPGQHVFELVNEGALPHNVTIEELDDRQVVEADPGQTDTGEVELEAGSYTYYCSVPGHRAAGMEGTLEVAE